MSNDVLVKDVRDRRIPTLGLGVGLFVISVALVGLYAGLRDTVDQLTAGFPAAMTSFIGGTGPGGYVVGELFNLIAPIALVGYAVVGGASALAGEEEKGTMAMLSAQPVTRTAILVQKATGLVGALVVAAVLFWAGITLAALMFGVGLDLAGLAAICLHLLFLSIAFGAIALAAGAITGNPGLAAAVAGGLAVVSYLADAMLPLAGLDGWAELSPWFYYAGSDPLVNGIDGVHLLVLLALAAVAAGISVPAFDRRDLKG